MPASSKTTLTSIERAARCAELALDKKAEDVKILDIGRISSVADYLVLASGHTDRQTQAIAESVRAGLKKFGRALDIEGVREGNWIVIDYGDVIMHVFRDETRRYYNLDELWAAAPLIELTPEPSGGAKKV
ncbi:MAG: ribosome silencing factor [Geobacteraceae bacterium]|nr:ribosome silencing factor [Geobacteraceae bacterium]